MHGYVKENVYFKYENEDKKLRMGGGSWSINMGEVPATVDLVVYTTDLATYSIKMTEARKHGFIKSFQDEVKLIVPLEYWEVESAIHQHTLD